MVDFDNSLKRCPHAPIDNGAIRNKKTDTDTTTGKAGRIQAEVEDAMSRSIVAACGIIISGDLLSLT